MRDATIILLLFVAVPLFLFILWLVITTWNWFASGWFGLQRWYADDGNEAPLVKLSPQTGYMGILSVHFTGLTLTATRRGLALRIMRIFGPFQQSLLIPWSEIEASEEKHFLGTLVRLDLGKPRHGRLVLHPETWAKLAAARDGQR